MGARVAGTNASKPVRRRILVRGAVQGVGFRPFVYGRAKSLGLSGWVNNTAEGVALEVEGGGDRVATLVESLRTASPPNAQVTAIEIQDLDLRGEKDFAIRPSEAAGERSAQILPDIATCPACVAELFEPTNRRYRYPFLTCTHCGPRYTIVEDSPYDRERTSMRHFPMCPACRKEYDDPEDRRFHAETNACPACGPRLSLLDGDGSVLARDDHALRAAAAAVREGRIVAVKGIGGFHLIVDARDEGAVQRLRARKRRPDKPFAAIFPSIAEVRAVCRLSQIEESLLTGPARPIVLLRRAGDLVAPGVAPGNPWLGAMLPYAPVHHLLLSELGFPVVATSGNTSDEPIAIDSDEALTQLGGIADLFLVHDRPIVRPVDDSVVRVVAGRALVLRRARGYGPTTIQVEGVGEGILAVGGYLKTTVALTGKNCVVVSPHIGDLETVEARRAHARTLTDIVRMHPVPLRSVARDLHPDYPSGQAVAAPDLPVAGVQHHLAHVVACMAENGIAPPALGVAWDGTGYGTDATIWGGEFLAVTDRGWRRVAHLRRFRLPGGEAAAREPRRAALGLLCEAFGDDAFAMTDLPPVASFASQERAVLRTMMARGVNAPHCSSMGRLFDAFAALCGLRQRATYEGQAAAELEWAADKGATSRPYEFAVREVGGESPLIVDWMPALTAALADLRAGAKPGAISAALHAGLARAIVSVAAAVNFQRVVLTGGCFQNAALTEDSVAALRASGFEPVWHRLLPPNDGGIALGQAVWTAWAGKRSEPPCA